MKPEIENELARCAKVLREGGVILYPTDTIWGLGCDATNEEAVRKIYAIKARDESKSMLLLCSSIEQVRNYVEKVPIQATALMDSVNEPLTIIYPKAKNLPNNLPALDGSIGIRIPRHEFCLRLIEMLGKPIVSTSANFSGEPSPLSFKDISPQLIQKVDYVVNLEQDKEAQYAGSKIVKITDRGEVVRIRN